MMLPRPYSNRWMLQGTRGVYYEEKTLFTLPAIARNISNGSHGSLTRINITINGRKICHKLNLEELIMLC